MAKRMTVPIHLKRDTNTLRLVSSVLLKDTSLRTVENLETDSGRQGRPKTKSFKSFNKAFYPKQSLSLNC